MLANKRILLIIGGGIAAYKTPELIRRLRERGAAVTPVLTRAAKQFVTPLSLSAVAKKRKKEKQEKQRKKTKKRKQRKK